MARVIVYYSSVAGNVKIKKEQTRVQDLLKAKGIEYELVDLAQDDKAKEYMKSKSGKTVIPQIFVDGEFKGTCEQLDDANEAEQLKEFLGV